MALLAAQSRYRNRRDTIAAGVDQRELHGDTGRAQAEELGMVALRVRLRAEGDRSQFLGRSSLGGSNEESSVQREAGLGGSAP